MKYFPYEKVIFKTSLSEEVILNRLTESIRAENYYQIKTFKWKMANPQNGNEYGNGFKIWRLTFRKYDLLRTFTGIIEHSYSGILITVKMQITIFGIISYIISMAVALTSLVLFLIELITDSQISWFYLTLFILLVLRHIYYMSDFNNTSKIFKQEISELLDADIVTGY